MHLLSDSRNIRDALLAEGADDGSQLIQERAVVISQIHRYLHVLGNGILIQAVRLLILILERGDVLMIMLLLAAMAVVGVPDPHSDNQQKQDRSNQRKDQNQPFLPLRALFLFAENIVVINGIILTYRFLRSRAIDGVLELVGAFQMHHRFVGGGRFGNLIQSLTRV